MKRWLIIGLLVLGLAALCCLPLQITNVKVMDDCGCTCLSWETNQEAQCKVTYCEGNMCSTSSLEPEYSTLHSLGIPPAAKNITITAISRQGVATSMEVSP